MPALELWFASGEDSLSVRRFTVRERLATPFDVTVWARSPNEDIDLASIVGKPASLRVVSGVRHLLQDGRIFAGLCSAAELEETEPTGLSTYRLRIVPALWLLTQRRNYRIFQHLSIPDIVASILAEWRLEGSWELDRAAYKPLEIRIQYGESDFDFVSRLLEEAGITYLFLADDVGRLRVAFRDRPHVAELRAGGPIRYVDNPNTAAEREYVSRVKLAHEVRPGRMTIRDADFRRGVSLPLFGEAIAGAAPDDALEQYRYEPGAFLVEGGKGGATPFADDRGVARHEERAGRELAERGLEALRADQRVVSFETNVVDLGPGVVFSLANHPRADLGPDTRLLVVERMLQGTQDGEWALRGSAVFAGLPYRPPRVARKPRVDGVQVATVVGPSGEEIHTDEFGRVRVQFSWDREGHYNERSSCWMRVSQGWAGAGFGMLALPRVGQEVLVTFLEGDPDQPIVVGRVFGGKHPAPYKLPEHRTRTTWRSHSTPGSDGFNEITFEDARGSELVYVQAERNLDKLVKRDETITVGRNRATTVTEVDEAAIGVREASHIKGSQTGREMVAGRISLTTGEATITLDGPNVTIQAGSAITLTAGSDIVINAGANVTVNGGTSVSVNGAANIALNAGAHLTAGGGAGAVVQSSGGDLVLQGGPMVKINPGGGSSGHGGGHRGYVPVFGDIPMVVPPDVDLTANTELAEAHAEFDQDAPMWFTSMVEDGGEWDFTQRDSRYEQFAALHYSVVGSAAGFPEGVLLRHYGKRLRETGKSDPEWGDPGNGLWGGSPPFGIDPYCYKIIKAGCTYYRTQRGNTDNTTRSATAEHQRISNLNNWYFFRIVNTNTDTLYTVGMRPYQEFQQVEYALWTASSPDPSFIGSIHQNDANNPWSDEGRRETINTIIRIHNL